MGSAVIKGLRFADTQEFCFEAWKHTYIACSGLLCGQFAYTQKSLFLALKPSYTGSAVLEGGRSAFINEFCFQATKSSDVDYVEVQGVLFADLDFETIVLSWKLVVPLIFSNSVFKLQNLELWTVSKYKGFYLLIQS